MENLTHSLVGAALAELALPRNATRKQRGVFYGVGVVAANLPDADLVYTRISPPPLGSLLHHRGHTHTVVGLIVLAMLTAAVCHLPAIRRHVRLVRTRLWTLIGLALLSHLVLDSWNSYGVHPFWPLESRWFYGDTIYILEPWLWLALGVPAVMNTWSRRGRIALGVLIALLVAVATGRVIPIAATVALVVVAAGYVALMRKWPARRRSAAALAFSALFVASMFGVHSRVMSQVLAASDPSTRGGIIDVVLSSEPANPLCWTALTITAVDADDEYVMTRGTATPFGTIGCGHNARQVAWDVPVHQSLRALRDLYQRDCAVRAWMRFGRAPEIDANTITDLRYGGVPRGNFTTMAIAPGTPTATCPPNIPDWGTPRRDLLGTAFQ